MHYQSIILDHAPTHFAADSEQLCPRDIQELGRKITNKLLLPEWLDECAKCTDEYYWELWSWPDGTCVVCWLSSTSMDYLDLEEAYLFGRAELEQETNIGGRATE
jgi:hypothetical protein